MDVDEAIQYAIEHTQVLRAPKQRLATFGTTNVYYYLIAQPAYADLFDATGETVIREGRVIAERPKIVTPHYLSHLFEGFEHGREYAQFLIRQYGAHEPGLLYRYRNEPKGFNVVSDPIDTVAFRLDEKIRKEGDSLAALIKGIDGMWDISLMKFIHDMIRGSMGANIAELQGRGLLDVDRKGIPRDARETIEALFEQTRRGECEPFELKAELDRWGLFAEYEDKFLALFRKG